LQVGFLAAVLIAVNNLRDAPQDVLVNKRTLAVRFGITFARIEISLLTITPFFLGIFWYRTGHMRAAVLPLLAVPVARRVLAGVWTQAPSPIYNRFLALSALVHIVFGLSLSIALYLT
jgi:1,4-dihydroxy-2-naphthoate octaprenyltransferase